MTTHDAIVVPARRRDGTLSRRAVLAALGAGATSLALRVPAAADEKEVSPPEDLMQEHGVLDRLLLVYEAALPPLGGPAAPQLPALVAAAEITRRFIEDYHERQEEEFVFPRCAAVDGLRPLVATLRTQHGRGRVLTDRILGIARAGGVDAVAAGSPLRAAVQAFIRMYRPHAAREDTVLFPAFRELVPEKDYDALGERFEEREHALFGHDGFATIVAEVAALETTLGIEDLNRFTPP